MKGKADKIEVFVPATVSNVACGFDIMGFPLESLGDSMTFSRTNNKKVQISSITGTGSIPEDPEHNTAGIVATELLGVAGNPFGVDITIHKRIRPGSGIGSSGASAAGAAFGINQLLGAPYNPKELVAFAMKGEAFVSGAPHADNVAPAIYGGFVIIRSYHPLDIISVESPNDLWVVVLHPVLEVKTSYARNILSKNISLKDATTQWGNVAGLVAGLLTQDYDLIGRSLVDVVAEPARAHLIPGFYELKQAAELAGALGCNISGSGPSVFALSKGRGTALRIADAFRNTYASLNTGFEVYVSKINKTGIRETSSNK